MTSPEGLKAPEETQLAVSYADYYVVARGLVFIFGIPLGILISTRFGKAAALARNLVAESFWIPIAMLGGLLLSLVDALQVRRHRSAFADIERARRLPRGNVFSGPLRDANRRHRRELFLGSFVPFLPGLAIVFVWGFVKGIWFLGILYGAELLCWRLIWRRRLLERPPS
jgi:hypothetical protein